MSVPGTDLETADPVEERTVTPGERPAETEDPDETPIVETVTDAKGAKLVPLSSLIDERRERQALKKQNAALKERADTIDQKLQEIQPTLDAIRANPKLIELANQTTRPSRTAEQPADDHEAQQWAEDNGLITGDGSLDVARARRQLDFLDRRAEAQARRTMAPVAAQSAQQQAAQHIYNARQVTLRDGSRAASDASIAQAFGMLPAEMAANPNVANVATIIAVGLDVLNGRRPRQTVTRDDFDEPTYVEGGGRRPAQSQITGELRHILEKTGVSEADFTKTSQSYRPGKPMPLE